MVITSDLGSLDIVCTRDKEFIANSVKVKIDGRTEWSINHWQNIGQRSLYQNPDITSGLDNKEVDGVPVKNLSFIKGRMSES